MKIEFIIPTVISVIAIIWSFFQSKIIEKLKNENAKKILVHKVQFETEFEVYKEIWGHLVKLRNSAKSLAPEFYKIYQDDPEFKKKQIVEFGKDIIKFNELIDENKPFCSLEVLNLLLEIKELSMPILHYGMKNPTEDQIIQGWSEFYTVMNNILSRTDSVCDEIRNRIGNIYV